MDDNKLRDSSEHGKDYNKSIEGQDDDQNQRNKKKDTNQTICGLDRKYLVPKGFYFFFFSAQGSLLPYLSLFLKQLELPASQVGVITGIKPFIAFFFIPIWSAIADRYHRSKLLFVVSMLAINFGLVAYAFAPVKLCEENHVVSKQTRHVDNSRTNSSSYIEKVTRMAEDSLDETPWPQADTGITLQFTGKDNSKKFMGVFFYLLLVTILSTILSCPSLTLGDSATVQQLKQNEETHKYGKQRLWGSVGWGSMAFLVGAAVSSTHLCPAGSARRKDVNYYPCFVTYGVFMLVALGIGSKLKFDDRLGDPVESDECDDKQENNGSVKSKTKGIKEGIRVMMTPRHIMFLITVFVVGICMGLIKVFLFWHLKDLGGTQLLFSYMAAVNCIAEVTVYFLSSRLISTLGHERVLYLGLFCYAVRLFSYAFITKPWYVLPIESLSGITTAAVWASLMSYVGIHSVQGVNVTLQGILHSVHWGLGHGCGEFIGGFFISGFGASKTFALFGIISLLDLFAYILVGKFAAETNVPVQNGYERVSLSDNEIQGQQKKE